jgi:8-oxo-dGTP diphosphatase
MVTCTTTVGHASGHIDVSLWYVVTAPRTQPIEFDAHEFTRVCWFPYADVPLDKSDPHLGRFLAKLGSDNRFGLAKPSLRETQERIDEFP